MAAKYGVSDLYIYMLLHDAAVIWLDNIAAPVIERLLKNSGMDQREYITIYK